MERRSQFNFERMQMRPNNFMWKVSHLFALNLINCHLSSDEGINFCNCDSGSISSDIGVLTSLTQVSKFCSLSWTVMFIVTCDAIKLRWFTWSTIMDRLFPWFFEMLRKRILLSFGNKICLLCIQDRNQNFTYRPLKHFKQWEC